MGFPFVIPGIAELFAANRYVASAPALLEMDAADKSNLGSEDGDEVAGYERMAAGFLPMLISGKVNAGSLKTLFKGLLTRGLKEVGGGHGAVASFMAEAAVQAGGSMLGNISEETGAVRKTNESIQSAAHNAGQGVDIAADLVEKAKNAFGDNVSKQIGFNPQGFMPSTPVIIKFVQGLIPH